MTTRISIGAGMVCLCVALMACTATAPYELAPPSDNRADAVALPGPDGDLIVPPINEDPDACGAERLSRFEGDELAAIGAIDVDGPLRVIRPGDVVTQDYRTDRLNIRVNRRDRIQSIYCG